MTQGKNTAQDLVRRLARQKRSYAAARMKEQLEREEQAAVRECLQEGLPLMQERYGHHSSEARACERAIASLKK